MWSKLAILELTGAQLFQLPGSAVLSEQGAVGTFPHSAPRDAVFLDQWGTPVVPRADVSYYTAVEDVDDGAWRLPYSTGGWMAVAAFSAAGFAVGRSIASLAVTAEAKPRTVPVVTAAGDSAGEATLTLKAGKNPEVFGHIVHRKLVLERRNARWGTANTKTRGEVRGGGRKPYPQKGTGNARRGSTRSPLIVGGGVTFGPKPKNWANKKMNRKEARLAISLALQSRTPSMTVVKDLEASVTSPKTAEMFTLLQKVGIGPSEHAKGKLEATSVIVSDKTENLYLSTRNIPYIKLLRADQLSVYDLLRPTKLLVSEKALADLNKQYGPDAAYKNDEAPADEEDGYKAGAENVEDAAEDIIDEMEEVLGDAPDAFLGDAPGQVLEGVPEESV
jgi:large subunit ribosomal protein L4